MNAKTQIETRVKTYCRICEAACGLVAELDGSGELSRLRPDREHPSSRGYVCAKGTRFGEVARHPARILTPRVRAQGGALREAGWDEATAHAGELLRRVISRHGPHAVGVYVGNPLAFNALGTVSMGLFTRALGTRNVFGAGTQDCSNKFAGARMMHGSPALHPIPDLARCELAVMFGTNPLVSQSSFVHLEGGARTFDELEARGADVVWVDVRETESAKRWGSLVRVRPGSDVWLLLALVDWFARRPSGQRALASPAFKGLGRLVELARRYPLERAAPLVGLEPAAIEALAQRIEAARGVAFHMSVGVNMGSFGTLSYVALQALSALSGNFDREGGSVFNPLAPRIARVARTLGIGESRARSRVGGYPAVMDSLPAGVLAEEIQREGSERIRALVVVAGDPVRSVPGAAQLDKALGGLDALISIDLFETATGRHADVILPARSWLERADISLTSAMLQHGALLQATPAVSSPMGLARRETRILADLSVAMGRPMLPGAWLTRLAGRAPWDALLGRLAGQGGIKVPTPRPGRYLKRGPLTEDRKVHFWAPELVLEESRLAAATREAEARTEGGYVLLGRRRRIGHNSWLQGGRRDGDAEGYASLHPADMKALGVAEGDALTLETRAGGLTLPARPDPGVAQGTVVVPHGVHGKNVNALIPSDEIERVSGMLRMTGIPVAISAS